jgi:phosphoglycolate phosphatase
MTYFSGLNTIHSKKGEIMKYKAVLFDLDGTLLDSLLGIADAMNRLLVQLNYPTHSLEKYRYFVGEGINELVKRALPQHHLQDFPTQGNANNELERLVVEYRRIYEAEWRQTTKPYEGIPEMLDILENRNIKKGILSNKADAVTKNMVEVLLPRWNFSYVLGARNGYPQKPDPAVPQEIARSMDFKPEEMIFVGDTDIDMQTGTRSNMYTVGVSWGFRDVEELHSNGADKIITHPSELLPLLQ